MRLLPLLILIFLIDIYAYQAFVTISEQWSDLARSVLFMVYWMVPIVAIGLTYAFASGQVENWDKKNFTLIRSTITLTYFSKFFIIVILLLGDIGRLFFNVYESAMGYGGGVERSFWLALFAIFAGVIPFTMLFYGMARNKYRYKIYRTKVSVPNLPKALQGLKIIQISDIHSGSFTEKEPIRNAIQMINEQQADLVFFTGDLVNSIANEMEPFVDVFDKIKSRYGIFSILGNHDYGDYVRWESAYAKAQNFEALKKLHGRLGWDLILNGNRKLQIKGEEVAVIGVENYSAHGRFAKYGDLEKAYEGVGAANLKLLLSHDPSHWEDEVLEKFQDIHITFSGHTHGMQFGFEIEGIIKWSPIKYVYKQWAGLYEKNKQYLYVNRGFGFLGYPGRVGILPEITVMELTSTVDLNG